MSLYSDAQTRHADFKSRRKHFVSDLADKPLFSKSIDAADAEKSFESSVIRPSSSVKWRARRGSTSGSEEPPDSFGNQTNMNRSPTRRDRWASADIVPAKGPPEARQDSKEAVADTPRSYTQQETTQSDDVESPKTSDQSSSGWSRIKETIKGFSKFYDHVKNFVPAVLLLLYSLVSASILFVIERDGTPNLFEGQSNKSCVGNNFWRALFYVNTLYTTIGYGNILACTTLSRFFSVIIAILGIPLVFIVLDTTGRMLGKIMNKICVLFSAFAEFIRQKRHGKLVVNDLWADVKDNLDDEEPIHVPIYLGVILTVLWILICAGYFAVVENLSYLQSIYFSLISFLTIGLGDISPNDVDIGVLSFAAVLIGLSLVSMSIKVVQAHIEHLFNQMQIDVIQEDTLKGKSAEDSSDADGQKINKALLKHRRGTEAVLNRYGQRYLQALFSEKQLQVLDKLQQKKIRMRIRGIQAVVQMESKGTNPIQVRDFFKDNKGVNAVAQVSEKICQTDPVAFAAEDEEVIVPVPMVPPFAQNQTNENQKSGNPVAANPGEQIRAVAKKIGNIASNQVSNVVSKEPGKGGNFMRKVRKSFRDPTRKSTEKDANHGTRPLHVEGNPTNGSNTSKVELNDIDQGLSKGNDQEEKITRLFKAQSTEKNLKPALHDEDANKSFYQPDILGVSSRVNPIIKSTSFGDGIRRSPRENTANRNVLGRSRSPV